MGLMNHMSPRLSRVEGPGGVEGPDGVKRPDGVEVRGGAVSVTGENGSMESVVVPLFTGGFL